MVISMICCHILLPLFYAIYDLRLPELIDLYRTYLLDLQGLHRHSAAAAKKSLPRTMAILLFLFFTSILPVSYTSPLPISENSTSNNISSHRRTPTGSCGTGNPVDDCWRCDPSWATNRQRLADCAIGFGRNALGGKNGRVYVVTDPGDDDPARPAPGTLRYGLVQHEPLWIVFDRDMTIRPRQELLVSSYKTVDGRGARVVVGDGGACFTLRNVSNVIIHGVTIRHCRPARKSATGWAMSDGDGVTVFRSRDVWVDRCSLEDCADGLVDVIEASTAVTVSNCLMTNHDKAMLLGHNDAFSDDRGMRVTVAFNRFGPGLVQRMPRSCAPPQTSCVQISCRRQNLVSCVQISRRIY
jgi:pectate lyase